MEKNEDIVEPDDPLLELSGLTLHFRSDDLEDTRNSRDDFHT